MKLIAPIRLVDAAVLLREAPSRVFGRVIRGELTSERVGKAWYLERAEVEAIVVAKGVSC
jgi:hypothetical protein